MKIINKHNWTFFLITLFWKQNKWHSHSVLVHTLRVVYFTFKAKQYHMLAAAFLHDIGKPGSSYQDEEDVLENIYSFTDHEELSFQLIKNVSFISTYTKNLVRYHYLIRDLKNSKARGNYSRYAEKFDIWNSLSPSMQEDLHVFIKLDDRGK